MKRTAERLKQVVENAQAKGLTVHTPLTFDTPKEDKIKKVVANTLAKIDPKDREDAKKQLATAAATGFIAKDVMGPDAHVNVDAVVNKDTYTGAYNGPEVTTHTTALIKDPMAFVPAV